MTWWFAQSNHDVKIVVLVKTSITSTRSTTMVNTMGNRILLEHWHEASTAAASHMVLRISAYIGTINIVWADPVPQEEPNLVMRLGPHKRQCD